MHAVSHLAGAAIGNGLVVSLITLAVAAGIALAVHAVVFVALRRIARRPGRVLDESIVRRGSHPAKWIFVLAAVVSAAPATELAPRLKGGIEHVAAIGLIAAIAWIIIAATAVVRDVISARYRIDVADNLEARKIATPIRVLSRVVTVVVIVGAVAGALMTLPGVKVLGASVLASAGVIGLVIGIAMRPTLANLVAGVQIALAQPFRIEDAVIVDNEWGWIEEINATYVVVRIWDWRRLIVPLSYFVEQPFQNWTRNSGALLGSVFLYADYNTPVDALRQELDRILPLSPLWDGQAKALQVTDASDRTIQIRILAGARTSPDSWDLRCYIRENMITFLQRNYPDSLPKTRGDLRADGLAPGSLAHPARQASAP